MKQFILKLLDIAINEFNIIDQASMAEVRVRVNERIAERIKEIDVDAIIDSIDIDEIIRTSMKSKADHYLKNSINSILESKFNDVRNDSDIRIAFGKSIKKAVINCVKSEE